MLAIFYAVVILLLILVDQELISYRYSSCCCYCWGVALQKSPRLRRFKSDRDEISCCGNVLQVNTHRLTGSDFWYTESYFQDGGHDVISGREVMPPVECTRSVCPARLMCSSVRQFLIYTIHSYWLSRAPTIGIITLVCVLLRQKSITPVYP